MFVCPDCHKQVKNLKQHQSRVHAVNTNTPAKEAPAAQKPGNTLTLNVETKKKTAAGLYHCIDCGGTLTQGQSPCPGCGSPLDWSALQ